MQIKFRDWLIFIFFGINLIIILFLTRFSYTQLEDSILEKTKGQLLSVNILKKRHIEHYLENKANEMSHFIGYAESHNNDPGELIDMLTNVDEVAGVVIETGSQITATDRIFAEYLVNSKHTSAKNGSLSVSIVDVYKNKALMHFHFVKNDTSIHAFLTKGRLSEIVLERSGMGATGESYLVSKDLFMQTPSRFFPDSIPETITVRTSGAGRVFADSIGTDIYKDYRNIKIVGAYRKVRFHNLEMALLTEIDFEEAMQDAFVLRKYYIYLTVSLIVISLIVSIVVAKLLTKPVSALKDKSGQLAMGILPDKLHSKSIIKEVNDINLAINNLINALKHTVLFAREIGRENLGAPYKPLSNKDELGSAILEMRNQLLVLSEQKQQMEIQRKKDLVNAQEGERERIARDIHDGIGPLLTTTKMKISALRLNEEIKNDLLELIDNTIKEIRSVSRNLMPGVLIDFGPAEAIAAMVEEIRKNTGFNISFQHDLSVEVSEIEKEAGIALFRIAQEAINNSLKHSKATEIKVSLTEFDEYVSLFIKDNGIGFDRKIIHTSEGKGLRNIKERVSILMGILHIESGENGTTIDIEIPKS